MSGLSRHMSLLVRSSKFTGSSVPTKSLRMALPGTRTLTDSRPETTETPFFQGHLNQIFYPLHFPKELAKRLLTHPSHFTSLGGHNGRFSFIGRRVLSAYLQLFLHSSSALDPSDDVEAIKSFILKTHFLGEHVGPKWGVGRIIRWTPSAPASELPYIDKEVNMRRKVGLYKVQGEAVEAIFGGIYVQFGAVEAQRVFHTKLLPHLLVNMGLPKVFHEDAKLMFERMNSLPLVTDAKEPTVNLIELPCATVDN